MIEQRRKNGQFFALTWLIVAGSVTYIIHVVYLAVNAIGKIHKDHQIKHTPWVSFHTVLKTVELPPITLFEQTAKYFTHQLYDTHIPY